MGMHVPFDPSTPSIETIEAIRRYSVERAKAAYRAYGQTTDFKNFQGNPMPEWDALPEKIREAWVNASKAAATFQPMVF